jgi:hypothetical protein
MLTLALALAMLATTPVFAQPLQRAAMQSDAGQQAAVDAAKAFVTRFDEADFGDIYDRDLSQTWKALMSRETFIQQGGFLRLQSGGRAQAREYIGAQSYSQTPTGARGEYYYVRFRTRHPNGLVFQDVYMEKVGSQWKAMGFNMMPAPQQ